MLATGARAERPATLSRACLFQKLQAQATLSPRLATGATIQGRHDPVRVSMGLPPPPQQWECRMEGVRAAGSHWAGGGTTTQAINRQGAAPRRPLRLWEGSSLAGRSGAEPLDRGAAPGVRADGHAIKQHPQRLGGARPSSPDHRCPTQAQKTDDAITWRQMGATPVG